MLLITIQILLSRTTLIYYLHSWLITGSIIDCLHAFNKTPLLRQFSSEITLGQSDIFNPLDK